jgi:RNA polymerase sigma-70 factor (ECF subfamily)
MMSAEEGEDLIERVRRGDPAALSQFLEAHRGALLVYVSRRLGDLLRRRIEPEDIVQETATAAFRSFASTNLAARDPFGWLCYLADQRIVDAYRAQVRSKKRSAAREVRPVAPPTDTGRQSFFQMLQASITTPSQACVRNEQQQRVFRAMETLPDDQRAALRMHFLEGLPSKEIAARLGKSDAAVRVMLSRSVRRLRGFLGDGSIAPALGPMP